MAVYEHDILVIGGGLAGMRAAITAQQMGADVAMISKVHPVRSHSNAAQGGINGPGVGEDGGPWEEHAFETTKASDYLGDQDAIEVLAKEGGREVLQTEHWGVVYSRKPDGTMAVRRFGGMGKARTFFVGAITGQAILHVLYEQLMKPSVYRAMRNYEEWFVTSLIIDEGQCRGAVAMNIRTGELHAITAKATIVATGGLGRVYEPSTNALICTGDGISLAYRAGAPIMDMEMVQIHPTSLKGSGVLITEGARGEGAYLLNKDGERFMEKYAPNMMELASRDVVSRAEQTEIDEGRGVDGCVFLDMRHLGETVHQGAPRGDLRDRPRPREHRHHEGSAAHPARRALHHGRRQDRRRRPDGRARPLLGRRGGLRQRARREPRRRELAARHPRLWPQGGGPRRAVDARARTSSRSRRASSRRIAR